MFKIYTKIYIKIFQIDSNLFFFRKLYLFI